MRNGSCAHSGHKACKPAHRAFQNGSRRASRCSTQALHNEWVIFAEVQQLITGKGASRAHRITSSSRRTRAKGASAHDFSIVGASGVVCTSQQGETTSAFIRLSTLYAARSWSECRPACVPRLTLRHHGHIRATRRSSAIGSQPLTHLVGAPDRLFLCLFPLG